MHERRHLTCKFLCCVTDDTLRFWPDLAIFFAFLLTPVAKCALFLEQLTPQTFTETDV